jgi:cysteine desulfurase
MDKRIYMDNAATTAVRPEVLEAMMPYFIEESGNASSFHTSGQNARRAVERTREQTAAALGARPEEIYFTSGGTESDNWAIEGVARANIKKGRHIVTTAIEHHAVLHTCEHLSRQGWDVTYLPVDEHGLVTPQQVEAAIRDDTALVSIMYANNEIGTIEPIPQISAVCRARGVPLHTDAVQAVGHVPINVAEQNIDLLSLSAHKFHGPKGVGALYIRRGVRIDNIMHGGAQERGKRPGTYNHVGIVGLGKAIEIACADIEGRSRRLSQLRDHMIAEILHRIPGSRLNGHPTLRLPGNVNVSIAYIEGEGMLLHLDLAGIDASSGSACTSGALDPSHVLLAIGLSHETAHGSLRFSLGEDTTREEIDYVIDRLEETVRKLREMSPLYPGKE